jgi:hypothetical protein
VSGDVGDFLAEAGSIVGGGAALGATLGFIGGSLVHDLRPQTDPDLWARKGGFLGGVVGLAVLAIRGVESAS